MKFRKINPLKRRPLEILGHEFYEFDCALFRVTLTTRPVKIAFINKRL